MDLGKMLERYSELLAVVGLNIQRGQKVNLAGEALHRELLHMISEQCYRLGAKHVNIDLIEPRLTRSRVMLADPDSLEYVPADINVKYEELLSSRGANLRLVGPEDPLLFEGLDAKKLNQIRVARYRSVERFYKEGIGRSRVHWCVAAFATPGWAARIFPGIPIPEATDKLWQAIFAVSRLESSGSSAEVWAAHNRTLQARAESLNALGIKTLKFTGPGTDLTVGLSPQAIFRGGSEMGPRGVPFQPNIPTEECFTTPNWRITSGTVRATRPIAINGNLVEGLEMKFDQGRIVDYSSKTHQEIFSQYIQSDTGASQLGEVALVGIDSPIFQTGKVFEEILLDENAACHIALGSAYKFCLKGSEKMSPSELDAIGCNESSAHTDIMISNEQVSVECECYNGTFKELIIDGAWRPF